MARTDRVCLTGAGQLWQQLQSWLSEGAIVACKSKPSGAAAAAEQGGQEDEDEDGSGGAALHGYGNVLQHLGEEPGRASSRGAARRCFPCWACLLA